MIGDMQKSKAVTTRRAAAVVALIAALSAPDAATAKVSWKSTSKPYPGVVVRKGRTGDNKNNVYAATISLCTSKIHVASTSAPSSMATPGTWAGKAGVQLAVNGDFFTWACGKPQIYGDAVGGGKRWPACQRGNDASHSGDWYHKKNGWIAFGQDWVEFSNSKAVKSGKLSGYGWYPGSVTTSLPSGVKALVSGFSQLVIDGKPVTCSSPTASSCFADRSDLRQRHPRTAMGLSKDRRTFILAVVDGRTSASIGMYGTELAALMAELGAWVAFNLDGGGSSAMWVKGQGYVNNPSDGSARAVANHWGIYAGSAGSKSATPGSCFTAGACFPTRVIGAETSLFKDMPQSWTGYAQAKLLQQKKITSGCKKSPDLMFCPKCAITRRQMVAFLVRAAKISTKSPPAKPTFTDVPTSASDYAIIEAAAKAGLTSGCGSGKFCPDKVVTRSTGAIFTVRAAGYALVAPAKPSFSDVPTTHSRYKYIETLKDRCVASGYSDGTFRPDEPLPRSHAAIWTVKALNLDGNNSCLKELCNGKDDDFDGKTDEDFTLLGQPCDSNDADKCKYGSYSCKTDGSGVRCAKETKTDIVEVCNGKDDDCDGATDEGCACSAGQTRACGSDVGACVVGTQTCAAGTWSVCAGDVGPQDELCNGEDDDCDGQTDEGCVAGGDAGVGGDSLPPPAGDRGGEEAGAGDSGGCALGRGSTGVGWGAILLLLAGLVMARRRRCAAVDTADHARRCPSTVVEHDRGIGAR